MIVQRKSSAIASRNAWVLPLESSEKISCISCLFCAALMLGTIVTLRSDLLDLANLPRPDVVDESPHEDVFRYQGRGAQGGDVVAHGVLERGERQEVDRARVGTDVLADLLA